MLFYEVLEVFKRTRDQNKDDKALQRYLKEEEALKTPHYVIQADFLGSVADSIPSEKRKKIQFKDIHLPHDEMFLSIISEDHPVSDAILLNIFDVEDAIEILAYVRFKNRPRLDHLHLRIRLSAELERLKVELVDSNLDKFYGHESKDELYKTKDNYCEVIANEIIYTCHLLNKEKQLREGRESRSFKLHKKAKGKKAYRNHTVIHLNTYKNITRGNVPRGTIEWNHSWVVRGHWRYFTKKETIGRDRKGEKTEKGRTWINPYQKNKDLEQVQKIRHIKA